MANYRKTFKTLRPKECPSCAIRFHAFLIKGRITTTLARAKEVRKIAEKLITKAIKAYDLAAKQLKEKRTNIKGQAEEIRSN